MADQLSLRLETDRPAGPARPAADAAAPAARARSIRTSTCSSRGGAGERALVADRAGRPAGRPATSGSSTPRARDLSAALPELAGLAVRVAARSAILDGELVVVDARGPGRCRRRWRARLARRAPAGRRRSSRSTCSTSTAGRCSSQPLVKRREALRRVLRPGDEVVAVPAIATEGRRAVRRGRRARGSPGSWRGSGSSPYLPGIRSRLWRFVAATPGQRRRSTEAAAGRPGGGRRRRPRSSR